MNTKEYRTSLANAFLNLLQEEQLEWKKGWNGWGKNTPMNGETKYKYKGINRFHLMLVSMMRGYEDPRWCTYTQIQKEGWKLVDAKGQGVKVEYWFPYDTEEKKGLSWQEFRERKESLGERYTLHAVYKTVFNAALIEGIPQLPEPEQNDILPDVLIDTLSNNMNVPIVNDGGDRAFYRPAEDKIHLPVPENFYSDYEYASTALHELAHATGAAHRLNRKMGSRGGEDYAFEELVAEISSCFMSVNLQTEQNEQHVKNHKAYVQSWIQVIQKTPETLVKAVQEAEKAASYMEYKAGILKREEYEMLMDSSKETVVDTKATEHPLNRAFDVISMQANSEIVKNKTEWGSWIGRVANVKRPQDYVDIDITGYNTWHEVIYTVLVVRANEIEESKSFSIKTDGDDFEQSLRKGFQEAKNYFQAYFQEALDKWDTDFAEPMRIYSPYTEHALAEHYEQLQQNGYAIIPEYQRTDIEELQNDEEQQMEKEKHDVPKNTIPRI